MSCLRSFNSIIGIVLSVIFLVACGDGGGGSESGPGNGGAAGQTYTIGGSLTGLGTSKKVTLINGSGGYQTVSANGNFTFTAAVSNGTNYSVAVAGYPEGQYCRVTNGSGVVNGANVTNVAVSCLTRMGGSMQSGQTLNPIGAVTTLAGTSAATDGVGSAANFDVDSGFAVRVGDYLYVTDTRNHTIRKITVSSGLVTTFAGKPGVLGFYDNNVGTEARFNSPTGIATDGTYLYVADTGNHTIRKIVIATGAVIDTLVGFPGLPGSADGVGNNALFNNPIGVATDGTNLYVAEHGNNTIRKVVLNTVTVTTLAGMPGVVPGAVNGIGSAARFNGPMGIAINGSYLYVAETVNNTIRKVAINTGEVTTLAGAPGVREEVDGVGNQARFANPVGVATTDGVTLYVTDGGGDSIRKIDINSGAVATLAGQGIAGDIGGSNDGIGSAAKFWMPLGIASDGTNLFVVDARNRTVRKILINTAAVTTLAGLAASTNGIGAAARFSRPAGVTTDGVNLYVADRDNNVIRKIDKSTGEVTTFAGRVGRPFHNDGNAASAMFKGPADVTTDGENLFVADAENHAIRRIVIASGFVTTVAGLPGVVGSVDGVRHSARFNMPKGIATDGVNLYVADTFNHIIRKIVISTGEVSTLAGTAGSPGWSNGTGITARFYLPYGITTDGANLYVADMYNNTIRKIVIATGVVTTLAGTPGIFGVANGTGPAAQFVYPSGITTDGVSLYVTEDAGTIRKIDIATATVTSLAGTSGQYGVVENAVGSAARFWEPWGITTDGSRLFVIDFGGNTVRAIQ